MAVAVETEVAHLKSEVASLREEGEIVRKMWASDVDRLTIELSRARAAVSDRSDPTRELFLELERMEIALAGERQRASELLEEKAARDSDVESLQLALSKELERSNAVLEAKVALQAQSKQEVEALENMLLELMGDFERVEVKNRTLADEIWSLRNSEYSSIFATEKKGMLLASETTPSTPRSRHTDEEPEMEHSVRSLDF